MPAPSRTSLEQIVAAGGEVLEADGLEGLTMSAVASRVGVRAPSLYKHVRSRGDLVALVAEAAVREVGRRLGEGAGHLAGDPAGQLRAMAVAVRQFAHERPRAFQLVFAPPAEVELGQEALAAASAPVLRAATALAGEAHGLAAARTLTAWVNGFVSMELAGAFRLGGNVEEAFAFGLERLSAAVAEVPTPV